MKRGIAVFASAAALMAFFYFVAGKWAIHHRTVAMADILRDRDGPSRCLSAATAKSSRSPK